MTVEYILQEVTEADQDWQKILDITGLRNLTSYLRSIKKPNGQVDEIRTKDYQDHAVFYGIASKTSRALVGTIFQKDPVINLPSGLAYASENIDGNGIGIVQQSRSVVSDVIRYGRCGLWVDFAQTDGPLSLADQDRYFATVNHYKPWQICNWREQQIGSAVVLTKVVLTEYRTNYGQDGFTQKSEKVYRELALETDDDGRLVYLVRIWVNAKQSGTGRQEWVVESETTPTDSTGQPFDAIPFTFVGSENNDSKIDRAPMLDMVNINIGHYRNSADYEDTVFYAGQTQPYMTGATKQYFEMMNEQEFYIGSRKLMPVPEGGSFGFATPGANPTVRQAMIDKVELMVAMGASFIDHTGAPKTATQAAGDERAQTSELAVISGNVTDAYRAALRWAAQFQGTDEPEFELNDDFSAITATPQMLAAWVQGWLQGAIPFSDYVGWLKRNGLVDPEKTVDQVRVELEEDQIAAGGGIDTQ